MEFPNHEIPIRRLSDDGSFRIIITRTTLFIDNHELITYNTLHSKYVIDKLLTMFSLNNEAPLCCYLPIISFITKENMCGEIINPNLVAFLNREEVDVEFPIDTAMIYFNSLPLTHTSLICSQAHPKETCEIFIFTSLVGCILRLPNAKVTCAEYCVLSRYDNTDIS